MNGRATGLSAVALLFVCLALAACGGGDNSPSVTASAPAATSDAPSASAPPTAPAEPAAPPDRDLLDLARRFRGLPPDTPRVARQAPYNYALGDSSRFTVIDLDTPKETTITATVRLVTDHAYFFVEDDASYTDSALREIGDDFESKVYPAVTADFGREWSPGEDADPRISILHANLQGAAGYFSSVDEYPQSAAAVSNEREMLYIDAGALHSPGASYNALVAHELQHLVHFGADPTEEAWVNEGLSQVAAELLGGSSRYAEPFLAAPDTQLNFWPVLGQSGIHYAESELFFGYLLDHYGGRENAAKLLEEPEDGIEGVNAYLKPFGTDFTRVFADFAAANYLDLDQGPYAHLNGDFHVGDVQRITGAGNGDDTVHQFGSRYLGLDPPAGSGTFTFDGSDEVTVGIPENDGPFWWSGREDSIDSRLTREFDLSGLQTATLRFNVWFDVEKGWDFGYVAASTDGGQTWKAVAGQRTGDYDPVGQAYGPAYTGESGGWVPETVDLSAYAGRKVLLRFELVNDDSASLAGLAVDDIEVPELGFKDTADEDAGWQAEGFTRISGPLRQRFIVQLVQGDQVQRVDLDAGNRATIPLSGPATVIISGATEETAETASYHWTLASP